MLDEHDLQRLTMLRTVCGALVGGVVLFGVATAVLLMGGIMEPVAPDQAGLLLPLAGIFTVASVLSAPFVESMLRKIDGTTDHDAALARFTGSAIIGFAIREGAALFALVAALITGNVLWGLGLAGLATFGMILAWPGEDALRRHIRGVGSWR